MPLRFNRRSFQTLLFGGLIVIPLMGVWAWGLTYSPQNAFAEAPSISSEGSLTKAEVSDQRDWFAKFDTGRFQQPLVQAEAKPESRKLPPPPKVIVGDTFVSKTFRQANVTFQGRASFVQPGEKIAGTSATVETIEERGVTLKLSDGRSIFYPRQKQTQKLNREPTP